MFVAACGGTAAPPSAPAPQPVAIDRDWVNETLERLTLREKAAQLVVPRIPGAYLPFESDAFERVRGWVEREKIGGVIVTLGPPVAMATKLNVLQRLADVPLLVTADMEHGPGQILNGGVILPYGLDNGSGTRFPPLMALGATGDTSLAYALGRITALEGRAAGVHVTFAPVVDVNNNPDNPIINTRSYGADPDLVARMAAAHVRGIQDHGMIATAKHFPGHGDTGTDSHIELPVITVDAARADSVELMPYRAAIDAGVGAVMSAHIAFPALTRDTVPATLSRAILTGLLREDLGFNGLVYTDAMDMGAIVRRWGNTSAPVMALQAGADLLLQVMPNDVPLVIDEVVAAVRDGRLSEARLDASVRRLLEAKARLGLNEERLVDVEALASVVGARSHVAWADEVAQRSITLVRDRQRLVPMRARRVLSIAYTDDIDPFAGRTFHRTLAERLGGLRTMLLDREHVAAEYTRIRAMADSADIVVFAPFIRVTAGKAGLALPTSLAALIDSLATVRPTVAVSFGNPYVLAQLPSVSSYVLAWGQWDAPQRAAALALTGRAAITGRLPIPLPGEAMIGDGLTVLPDTARAIPSSPLRNGSAGARPSLPLVEPAMAGMDARLGAVVDSIVLTALTEGAAPGAAVAVGRDGRIVHLEGYGTLDRSGARVTDSTIYDLASLTKVVATTTALMMLVDDGLIALDDPVSRHIPEWTGDAAKMRVTIRQLLTHEGGLAAFAPLWRRYRGTRPYIAHIAALPLEYAPGTRTVYSDFGAIMLGAIVERVSGRRLDEFAQQRIFGPLGMRDTGFNPIWWVDSGTNGLSDDDAAEAALLARIAPTEVDTLFRERLVRGNVHDENAYAMGGVAGHAGLFSSARDLAVFAQLMLGEGEVGGVRLIRAETVRAFTRRQSERSSRALGWDTPAPRSSAGDHLSAGSFGHTGFTGTSLWIDPERRIFVILLANRVYPSRDNQRHIPLRRALADAVALAVQN